MRPYTAEENAANVALIGERPQGCEMSRLKAGVRFSRPILDRYLRLMLRCGLIRSDFRRRSDGVVNVRSRIYFLAESEVPS